MALSANQVIWYPTVPPAFLGNFQVGDLCFNNAPTAGQPTGWQCTVAGTPGTWVALASGPVNVLTVTATSGAIPNGYSTYLVNAATTPALTLPLAEGFTPGFKITIINLANNTLTLSVAASDTYANGGSPTLTQYQILNLVANGTVWIKAS
jgi:hypothetical protein